VDAFLEDLSVGEMRLIRCQPMPDKWLDFCDKYNLTWTSVDFDSGNKKLLPSESGLYCFMVGPPSPGLPPAAYPFYAGMTTHLKERYGQYLAENVSQKGRVHVRKFLMVFDTYLQFFYTPHKADRKALEAIEKELNDALMPHYSRKDFSAETKKKRNAWS